MQMRNNCWMNLWGVVFVLLLAASASNRAVRPGLVADARIGEWALLVGNTFGAGRESTPSSSLGVVSGTVREKGAVVNLHISALVNPGSIGAPVFEGSGLLLGIVARRITAAGGQTMVVPIDDSMSNTRIDKILRVVSKDVEGQLGLWKFTYWDVQMMCVTDESHDRMRVMSARVAVKDVSRDELMTCMEANFDRALDARYCVYQGKLWCAFIHPLRSLTDQQFQSALNQVAGIHQSFGHTYSSGQLIFNPGEEKPVDLE